MNRKRLFATVVALLTLGILMTGSYAQGRKTPPNIVFILADDLSWNLIEYMPNVQAMQKEGVTFSNYFVANSLCCPSRSSIFTGKLPHNTGVLTNTLSRPDGGYAAFLAYPTPSDNNEHHTFAVALNSTGYKTAMLGKYLNGYIPKKYAPPTGWTEWDVAGDGYANFNYNLNQNGTVKHYGKTDAEYLTDVVAGLADKFIRHSPLKPFIIEIATFAPHAPYIPAPRDADKFPGLGAPRSPAFGARPDSDSPGWLKIIPSLTPVDIEHIDIAFRKRAQSVQAIDKMIGQIRATLEKIGKDKNTYIIFSSDNGLHMGEYSLNPGKQTPYDIDIRRIRDVLYYLYKSASCLLSILDTAAVVTPNCRPNSAKDTPYSFTRLKAIFARICGNLPLLLPERSS
jgi:arylsulfatase A-like enzyme